MNQKLVRVLVYVTLYAKYLVGEYPNLCLRKFRTIDCPNCNSHKTSYQPKIMASGVQVVQCLGCGTMWQRDKSRFQMIRI